MSRPLLGVLLFCLAIIGCDRRSASPGPANQPPVSVYTTFYPTTYFAERIGGDLVNVVCPVPSDADPIFWLPSIEAITEYQSADIIVINGASFEKWVDKVSLPASRVVDTAMPFKDQFVYFDESVTHSHGPQGDHTHKGIDGHTWLDPQLAKLQATAIKDALVSKLPNHKKTIEANFNGLIDDLDALHQQFQTLTKSYGGQTLFASHPAYNYIAKRYGWKIKNFDVSPEEPLSEEAIAQIQAAVDADQVKVMLWESGPIDETVKLMKEQFGLETVVFQPAEMVDGDEDYLAIMKANLLSVEPFITAK